MTRKAAISNRGWCRYAGGQSFEIFQNLGSGSQGCKLDGGLLAEAAAVLRRAADEGADILFFNKFGQAEIENRGLNGEYLAAVSAGIPVITAVCRKYLDGWRQFCGGEGTELPPDSQAAAAWARASRSESTAMKPLSRRGLLRGLAACCSRAAVPSGRKRKTRLRCRIRSRSVRTAAFIQLRPA
ncbi:DUF2478 domain-containing protein [Kingella potus]|uniref:DUF2478 domain-containing protein n=1 Tax=Kingella potus TaxID=265175 RepID=UPI001FD302D1|nr:DUF2478 domain-containing protein [Kingella potus]UOP01322.1 DUF2478 domain-containing protein [Kingella potus]